MHTRTMSVVTAAAMTALILVGCAPQTADQSSEAPSTGAETRSSATPTDAVIDEHDTAVGVDLTDLGEPVASADVPAVVEGDPDATMTVAFYGLERQEKIVIGTYSFTVHSDSTDPEWLYGYLGDQGWHPYLVDPENLNKHDVLSGDSQPAQTAYQGMKFLPGQTLYAYAMFAAPPEDVAAMDVAMVDSAPMVTGVEIR